MEVRNITPNYTSNATSFGMAFKRPTTKQMEEFTEYVTKKGKTSSRQAKRGITTIINRHKNDRHFDFAYTEGNKFEFVPTSAKAKQMMNAGMLPEEIDAPKGIIEKTREKYYSDVYKAKVDEAEGFQAFWLVTKQVAAALKARLALEFKPVDTLPRSMRKASAKVKAYEKAVDKQIAKEAKEAAAAEKAAAKRAKAAEKARVAAEKAERAEAAAKQKAIDTVASAFEPKKK